MSSWVVGAIWGFNVIVVDIFFILLLSMAVMDKKKVEEYFEIMKKKPWVFFIGQ